MILGQRACLFTNHALNIKQIIFGRDILETYGKCVWTGVRVPSAPQTGFLAKSRFFVNKSGCFLLKIISFLKKAVFKAARTNINEQ